MPNIIAKGCLYCGYWVYAFMKKRVVTLSTYSHNLWFNISLIYEFFHLGLFVKFHKNNWKKWRTTFLSKPKIPNKTFKIA